LDQQLRGSETVSRLLFLFQADERRHKDISQIFSSWVEKEPEVTGVLCFVGGIVGLHLLEGPTPRLYAGLQFLHSTAQEELEKTGGPLLTNLRILYVGELYTTRASLHWCSFSYSSTKTSTGALGSEATDTNRVFHAYKTLLVASLKVRDQIESEDEEEIDFTTFGDTAPAIFRGFGETLVAQDDLVLLCGKDCDSLFDYDEFEELFILPPQLRLESDKLWPMPPPPVY